MAKSLRKGRWHFLHPRTATKPIELDHYLEMNARSRVVDSDRLMPEWKAWYDRVTSKRRQSN